MLKIALILIFFSAICSAKVTDILVWEKNGDVKLIIPQRENETAENLAKRYITALNRDDNYQSLMEKPFVRSFADSGSNFKNFLAFDKNRPNIALVANRPGHMSLDDLVFPTVIKEISLAGANPHIIPVGLELVLDQMELQEFHDLIAEKVPTLIHLGGADIHPSLYGEKFDGARDTFLSRDKVEFLLAKTYIKKQKGMIVGFCRGHQLLGVVQGLKLIQDIPSDGRFSNEILHSVDISMNNDHGRESAYHEITISPEENLLKNLFGQSTILVNSRHHQSVAFVENHSDIIFSGSAGEPKIVEAMEFKNGRGHSFQFHPEDMQTMVSRKILRELIDRSKLIYHFETASKQSPSKMPRFLCRSWRLSL